jgi:hypothetical protein
MLAGHDIGQVFRLRSPTTTNPTCEPALSLWQAGEWSWLLSISTVPIDWVGTYCRGIRSLDGYAVRFVPQSAISTVEAVRRWSAPHA